MFVIMLLLLNFLVFMQTVTVGDLPKAVVPSLTIQRLWDELAHHSLTPPLKYVNSPMEERVDVGVVSPVRVGASMGNNLIDVFAFIYFCS